VWVIDTDTLALWLRAHPEVTRQAELLSPAELGVTVITVEEVLGGWYAVIRQARDDDKLAWAYHRLQQSVEFMARVRILGFTPTAISHYNVLRKKHRRSGKNDLRIAAIVLENGGTLVTRNLDDFRGIAGLNLEDWSS
jgi:tRNA(fMet)-specific endonuclease VapC